MSKKYEIFKNGVIEYLQTHDNSGDLYILGDFYTECVVLLGLNFKTFNYNHNRNQIRYYLNKMIKSNLIESHIVGSGYGGKSLFGMKHIASYSIKKTK